MALEASDEQGLEAFEGHIRLRQALWLDRTNDYSDDEDLLVVKAPAKKKRRVSTRPVKWYRTKAYSLALDFNNALRPFGGLERLRITDDVIKPDWDPLLWPHANVATDAGADVVCMESFCEKQLRLNITKTWDTSHGVWNDTLGSIFDVGQGAFLYVLTIIINVMFMPFGDGRFGGMIIAGAKEYSRIFDHREQMFQFYYERFACEKDMCGEEMADGGAESLFKLVVNSPTVTKKAPRLEFADSTKL